MDSLTHALTGSLVADMLPFTRRLGARAQIAAVVAGMAPDLDMAVPFIANFPPKAFTFQGLLDQRLAALFHRTYTHSFFYTLVACLLLAGPIRRLLGGRGAWWQWAALLWLAIASHILLDITNPWEVRCWLPFSREGEAWTLMPLLDPFFTGLLALVFVANHALRDPFPESAPLSPRREAVARRLDRLAGIATVAWIAAALLLVRVWLTALDILPRPELLS